MFAGFRRPSKNLDLQFGTLPPGRAVRPDHPPRLEKVSQVPGLLGSHGLAVERNGSRVTGPVGGKKGYRASPCTVLTHTRGGGPGATGHESGPHHGSGNFVKNAETAHPLHTFVPFQLILLFCLNCHVKHQTCTCTCFEETELVTKSTAPTTWPHLSLPEPFSPFRLYLPPHL